MSHSKFKMYEPVIIIVRFIMQNPLRIMNKISKDYVIRISHFNLNYNA